MHARLPTVLAFLVLLAVHAVVTVPPAAAQQRTIPTSREAIQLSFAPLVRQAAPAVVNIYTRVVVREQVSPLFDDPLFRRFFGPNAPFNVPRERVQNSLGSGVIVDADGLIVTNAHVIRGATEITVVLSDRREFEARLVLADPRTDLAVLRIDARGLPVLPLGDADALQVGDLALAIGNPFGVGQTVTMGIVSAVARTGAGITDYNFFIQTDAAINPGNSGGALLGMDGRLIGINTAIFSRSGGSIGIGFAVPVNMVRVVADAARSGRRLVRPWLGFTGQPVTAEIAQAMSLARPVGVLVNQVEPASPAGRAGLRRGDVVVGINDREVDDPDALRYRFATLEIGSRATLRVLRGGREQDVAFTTVAPPEDPPRDARTVQGRNPLAGATVANLSPALLEELTLPGLSARQGVVVLEVAGTSTAGRVGFRPGDVIQRINGREVRTVGELIQTLQQQPQSWQIQVRRGEQVLNTSVPG